MKPDEQVQKLLFQRIDENKDSNKPASQEDINLLSHIMLHDLGVQKAAQILHSEGFYDHLNVDCKLDYDKWIYVDKKNRSGAGINSFHDITYKLLYEMKQKYLIELKQKDDKKEE